MKRSDQADTPSVNRRRVFAAGGTVGVLAAAAAALPLAQQSVPVAGPAKAAPEKGGGYQLTQHVLDYYQSARV
jgi:hypothetical protein